MCPHSHSLGMDTRSITASLKILVSVMGCSGEKNCQHPGLNCAWAVQNQPEKCPLSQKAALFMYRMKSHHLVCMWQHTGDGLKESEPDCGG